jgi:cytoskeletal protein CcmA (bactofilin family)
VWNKRTDEQPAPARPQSEPGRPYTPPPTTPQQIQPPAPARTAAKQTAVIGASMSIKGDIRTQEELFVDGDVEGTLESKSLLTVGPNGKVRANIKAREVIVFGSVRGNVDVVEKVAIRDNGSVIGDIKTAGISIDDGSYFKGSIDIVRPDAKPTTKPVRSEAASAASASTSATAPAPVPVGQP